MFVQMFTFSADLLSGDLFQPCFFAYSGTQYCEEMDSEVYYVLWKAFEQMTRPCERLEVSLTAGWLVNDLDRIFHQM